MINLQHTTAELIAMLRLQHVPNIGSVIAKKLIAHCGSPSAIFEVKRNQLLKIDGIGTQTIKHLFDAEHLEAAEKEYRYCETNAIEATYFKDDTSYGTAFCEQFIADIAPLNPIIVSGFAYGVDICIQREAIKHGLQTIGCLAHGLNQIYPKVHAKYQAEVSANGGFYTEFWSTSNPERENFLKRNRIIAGMSEATLVVESAEKGGSLVTADIANSYNRDVFAVPGRASDKYSLGCNNLIKKQQAHMLTSAADLIYLLNWDLEEKKTKTVQKSTTLLAMEMKGVIRPLPGKLFEAI